MTTLSAKEYIAVCDLLGISAYLSEIEEFVDNREFTDGELFIEMARRIGENSND